MGQKKMFEEYPDVVDIKQLCQMLGGVGVKSAYRLLHEGDIRYYKIGRAFRIPKRSVVEYFCRETRPN